MIANCKECGKVYQKQMSNVCPACVKAKNDAIAKIDSYAFKNKDLSVEKIAKNTQLSPDTIKKLISEGKVNSVKQLKEKCDMCGTEAIVSTSTFLCNNCVTNIKAAKTKEVPEKPNLGGARQSGMRSRKD